jgi:hypothetical protein
MASLPNILVDVEVSLTALRAIQKDLKNLTEATLQPDFLLTGLASDKVDRHATIIRLSLRASSRLGLLEEWALPPMDLWVIYPSGRLTSAKARAFVKSFEEIVRASGLADSMSQYLIRRIEECRDITLLFRTEIVRLDGAGNIESVTWRNRDSGETETHPIRHIFSMTGADRNTAWLEGCVALDSSGFVKTGADLAADDLDSAGWPIGRRPYLFETSVPGVFAVGDIRSGSVKRVASAVGEGSVVVQLVHRELAG